MQAVWYNVPVSVCQNLFDHMLRQCLSPQHYNLYITIQLHINGLESTLCSVQCNTPKSDGKQSHGLHAKVYHINRSPKSRT